MAIDQEYADAWKQDPVAPVPAETGKNDDYTSAWKEDDGSFPVIRLAEVSYVEGEKRKALDSAPTTTTTTAPSGGITTGKESPLEKDYRARTAAERKAREDEMFKKHNKLEKKP